MQFVFTKLHDNCSPYGQEKLSFPTCFIMTRSWGWLQWRSNIMDFKMNCGCENMEMRLFDSALSFYEIIEIILFVIITTK